jgi:hypothetical protein
LYVIEGVGNLGICKMKVCLETYERLLIRMGKFAGYHGGSCSHVVPLGQYTGADVPEKHFALLLKSTELRSFFYSCAVHLGTIKVFYLPTDAH